MTPRLIRLRVLADRLTARDIQNPVTVRTLRRYCSEEVDGMRYFDDSGTWLSCEEWYDEYILAHTKNSPKAAPEEVTP